MTIKFNNNVSATIVGAEVPLGSGYYDIVIDSSESSQFNFLPTALVLDEFAVATLETADKTQMEIVKLLYRGTTGADMVIYLERGYETAEIPTFTDFSGGSVEIRITAKTMDDLVNASDRILLDADGNVLTDGVNIITG